MTIPSKSSNNKSRRYRYIPYLTFQLAVTVSLALVRAPWLPPVRAWTTKPTVLLPPPLLLTSIPLPVKLAGGLFLFGATSSAFQTEDDRALREEILRLAEGFLRADPLVSMELGLGIEAGGVFASSSSVHRALVESTESRISSSGNDGEDSGVPKTTPTTTATSTIQVTQMSMEFQLNGGNSWAQAKISGIRYGTTQPVQLISLGVANMDASLNGGWVEVALPHLQAPPLQKYI